MLGAFLVLALFLAVPITEVTPPKGVTRLTTSLTARNPSMFLQNHNHNGEETAGIILRV